MKHYWGLMLFLMPAAASGQVDRPVVVGNLAGGVALTGTLSGRSLSFQYLKEPSAPLRTSVRSLNANPRFFRWRSAFGRLWMFDSADHRIAIRSDYFLRLSLEKLLSDGDLQLADCENEATAKALFVGSLGGPLQAIIDSEGPGGAVYPVERRIDFLPLDVDTVRFFCLYNIDLRFSESAGEFGKRVGVKLGESAVTPRWNFDVWDYRGKYNPISNKWEWNGWSHVETIEPLFTESFYAFSKGPDYYFVTESGKLYLSHKPTQGPRKMELVWGDAGWQIRAIITDTDQDRTYVFGRKLEGKDVRFSYFELDAKPDVKSFDPAALKPVKAEGDLGIVLRYAQLIGYPVK